MTDTRGSRTRPASAVLPWWAWIPAVAAGVSVVALVVSMFVPWFTGPDGYVRTGPPGSIGLIVASTIYALVLMIRRSQMSWMPGLFTMAATLLVLVRMHAETVCPDGAEGTCFTEVAAGGSIVLAVAGLTSVVASFAAPRLTRYAEDRAFERRRAAERAG